MKLGFQIHLVGLSVSNTVSILEMIGIERAQSTVQNCVHKTDSPKLVDARITWRLMRPQPDSTISNIGCLLWLTLS